MNVIPPNLLNIMNRDYSASDYQYECLMKEIAEFEKRLDNEHEIALLLASFGQSITLSVTNIDYKSPSLILFYGFVNGQPSTLVQHISQLNFLLTSVPKHNPDEPPRRIGFDTDH